MDALSIHLAPLVFELYEGLIHESHSKIPSALEAEVMLAEMIAAIAEKFPQSNLTREDALHWKDVALEILDNYCHGRDIPDDWDWMATVESSFDRLIQYSDHDEERRPAQHFRDYYLGWCGQTGREPVAETLPKAQSGPRD
ncbi:MAG: hypothetical protein JNK37_20360 [Verrucomicrobiales bacterium]|nr:hypothetical protein [Verrucomicrobiales bacterium]